MKRQLTLRHSIMQRQGGWRWQQIGKAPQASRQARPGRPRPALHAKACFAASAQSLNSPAGSKRCPSHRNRCGARFELRPCCVRDISLPVNYRKPLHPRRIHPTQGPGGSRARIQTSHQAPLPCSRCLVAGTILKAPVHPYHLDNVTVSTASGAAA
jgi:hypothetical protein